MGDALFHKYKIKMLDFLQESPMATISTLSQDGKPQSSVIAFAQTEDFEIVFETFFDTRKFANLSFSPNVAIATGFSPVHHITFQYEGITEQMESPEKIL